MALYFCLNEDGTGVVTEENPIQTKHTSNGEAVTIPVYIFNDGKRKGVPNDQNPPPLIYTNVQIRVEGVAYVLQEAIPPSTGTVNLTFENTDGWNIGTIIKAGTERMRIEEITSKSSIVVQRDYKLDGGTSSISGHNSGTKFIAETKSVSLALPSPNDPTYAQAGTFGQGGESLTAGLDPTLLTQAVDSRETTNVIKSSSGVKYHIGSLIKIDSEIMKVTAIANNDLTVLRGYNGTQRANHTQNAIIYCVGMVDIAPYTHKIFVKNSPPPKLPTQKKRDIKLVLVADEEPA